MFHRRKDLIYLIGHICHTVTSSSGKYLHCTAKHDSNLNDVVGPWRHRGPFKRSTLPDRLHGYQVLVWNVVLRFRLSNVRVDRWLQVSHIIVRLSIDRICQYSENIRKPIMIPKVQTYMEGRLLNVFNFHF